MMALDSKSNQPRHMEVRTRCPFVGSRPFVAGLVGASVPTFKRSFFFFFRLLVWVALFDGIQ